MDVQTDVKNLPKLKGKFTYEGKQNLLTAKDFPELQALKTLKISVPSHVTIDLRRSSDRHLFSSLKQLTVKNAEKLIGLDTLPLTTLKLSACRSVKNIPHLPCLETFSMDECDRLDLKRLSLPGVKSLTLCTRAYSKGRQPPGSKNTARFPDSYRAFPLLSDLNLDLNGFTDLLSPFPERLRRLTLRNNYLTRVPDGFEALTSLEEIELAYNEITVLPAYFATFSHLTLLELSHNKIQQLRPLAGLQHLKELVLRDCSLTDQLVKSLILQIPRSVERLDLSLNEITQFPVEIIRLHDLTFLDLIENPIASLYALSFLPKLKVVLVFTDELPDSITTGDYPFRLFDELDQVKEIFPDIYQAVDGGACCRYDGD